MSLMHLLLIISPHPSVESIYFLTLASSKKLFYEFCTTHTTMLKLITLILFSSIPTIKVFLCFIPPSPPPSLPAVIRQNNRIITRLERGTKTYYLTYYTDDYGFSAIRVERSWSPDG